MVTLSEQQQRELDDLLALDEAEELHVSDARLGRLQELLSLRDRPSPDGWPAGPVDQSGPPPAF